MIPEKEAYSLCWNCLTCTGGVLDEVWSVETAGRHVEEAELGADGLGNETAAILPRQKPRGRSRLKTLSSDELSLNTSTKIYEFCELKAKEQIYRPNRAKTA